MAEIFTLFDIPLQGLSLTESIHAVINESHKSPVRVFFVDGLTLVRTQDDKAYKRSLQLAEFCFSKGLSIQLAAKFLGHPQPPQISPNEWISTLFDCLQKETGKSPSFFCLGVEKDSIPLLPHLISERWPLLTLVGCEEAPASPNEEEGVVSIIEQLTPTILLVGSKVIGSERFICRHWHRLQYAGIKIAIASQDALDVLTYTSSNAPRFARELHLHRLWHVLLHPVQSFARYIKGSFRFFLLLIKQKGEQS